MVVPSIPQLPRELLRNLEKANHQAILLAMSDVEAVQDPTGLYSGEAGLLAWSERYSGNGCDSLCPISAAKMGNKIVVTVLTRLADTSRPVKGSLLDWQFELADNRMVTLTITDTDVPPLPEPAAEFVRAANALDCKALVNCFDDDALINDQLREVTGKRAIEDWAETEIIKTKFCLFVRKVECRHENFAVTAQCDGNFDRRGLPDPLLISFYFSLHHGKISQLIILRTSV